MRAVIRVRGATGPKSPSVVGTSTAITGKVLRSAMRSRQLAVVVTVQGVLFWLIFRFVFGGAIESGGLRYVDYMVPGIVTVGILFTTARAAVGAAQERSSGFVEHVRSLPAPLSGAMAGRVLGETVIAAYAVVVNAAVGFLIGFRIRAGAASAVADACALIAMGAAFAALLTALGYRSSNAEAASGLGLLALPFSFFSSARSCRCRRCPDGCSRSSATIRSPR